MPRLSLPIQPQRHQAAGRGLLKKLAVGARADEDDHAARAGRFVEPVDQQEIAADMAFAMVRPPAFQGMVPPFGPERRVVRCQKERLLS